MRRMCALALLGWLGGALLGQTRVDLNRQGKNIDFTNLASTKPFRTGTELPAACSVGEAFFDTDAPAGKNWFACTAANVWTLQSGSGLPEPAGQGGKVLTSTGAAAEWTAAAGDVTGAASSFRVEKVQGRAVADAAPASGQVLRWNSTSSQWEPQAPAVQGVANYSHSFTGQTAVSVPGSTHGLGTASIIVDCYDSATPNLRLSPSSVTVHPTSFDVTVQFSGSQSGRCVLNGSGGGGNWVSPNSNNTFAGGTTQTLLGALVAKDSDRTAPAKAGSTLPAVCTPGDQFFKTDAEAGKNLHFCTSPNTWTQMRGGGEVASVFGRTGVVTAQAGDYSFAQIGGAVADSQIAAGVSATKIGAGAVTNTAFGYLANVTGDVQAQLNQRASASHSHTLGGDLSGDAASATVARVQGRAVSAAAPAGGQVLTWNAAGNGWEPASPAAPGAAMASELGDLALTRSTATVLTAGANCSDSKPCNVRFGNVVYSFTRSCTATITGGTGMAYVYVASGGVLTFGHNLTVAASSGCLAQSGVTSFPGDVIPLATWTASSGTWDAGGGRELRAWLSLKGISAGTGIATIESGGRTTVGVDTATVPTFLVASASLNFPAIASGACAAEQTFSQPGALIGDSVAPGWPAGLEAGLIGTMRVSAANTIAVRLCNFSGSSVDPANGSYRATIVRSF